MSATLIQRIIEVTVAQSGPLPDEAAHRRYLATLTGPTLADRLAALQEPTKKEKNAAVKFWGARRPELPPVPKNRAYAEAIS